MVEVITHPIYQLDLRGPPGTEVRRCSLGKSLGRGSRRAPARPGGINPGAKWGDVDPHYLEDHPS